MRKVVFSIIACFVLAGLTAAQTNSGTFRGVVRDSSGDTLPGVDILLKNLSSDAVSRTRTNSEGEYLIVVPLGPYELHAQLKGFIPVMVSDLRIEANETIIRELTLREPQVPVPNPLRRVPSERTKSLPEGAAPSS